MFSEQVRRESMNVVFTEYAWDLRWCDPCAAEPLSPDELKKLGVFWLSDRGAGTQPDAFITRLHVRYDRAHFPDDLVFQTTGDQNNYQARYVLHHPWKGTSECSGIPVDGDKTYTDMLRERHEHEAANLAQLTGWNIDTIRRKMNLAAEKEKSKKWWEWGSLMLRATQATLLL